MPRTDYGHWNSTLGSGFDCVFEVNELLCFQTTFPCALVMPTVWVRSNIRRLCFISVRLTCHLKEEIILFVLHLSVSAAKACCKADQRPPAAELTFWLPRYASFVEPNTVFCMEELQLCGSAVPTSWSPAMVSTNPFHWLACIVGPWCEHQASFSYLARHGLWSSIIPSAFIFWLFFFSFLLHLHN